MGVSSPMLHVGSPPVCAMDSMIMETSSAAKPAVACAVISSIASILGAAAGSAVGRKLMSLSQLS